MKKGNSLITKLLSDGIWGFLGCLLMPITTLISSTFLARMLSVDEVGVYFFSVSFVLVISLLTQMGMDKTIVRFGAEASSLHRRNSANMVIRRILFLGLFASVISHE